MTKLKKKPTQSQAVPPCCNPDPVEIEARHGDAPYAAFVVSVILMIIAALLILKGIL